MAKVKERSEYSPLFEGISASGSMVSSGKCSHNNQKSYDGSGTCYCGLKLVQLKSNTPRNPGRWFLRCPLYKSPTMRCDYFEWVDEIKAKYEDKGNDKVEGSFGEYSSAESNVDNMKEASVIEANMKVLMKMVKKMKGDIKRLEIFMLATCLGVGACFVLNLYTIFK